MIAVFADAPSDLSPTVAQALDIQIIPVNLHFRSGIVSSSDVTGQDVINLVRQEKQVPITSPLTPEQYASRFQAALNHYGEVISIHTSTQLSRSFVHAQQAAQSFGGRVHVVDSTTVTFAEGMQAIRAARMRDDGYSSAEIVAELERVRQQQFMNFMVDTLDHLRISGRVSGVSAFLGSLFGIKPLLGSAGGEVVAVGRARGTQNGLKQLAHALSDHAAQRGGSWQVAYIYTPGGEARAAELRQIVSSWGFREVGTYELGSLMTNLAGPGAVGLAAEPVIEHSRHRANFKATDGTAY